MSSVLTVFSYAPRASPARITSICFSSVLAESDISYAGPVRRGAHSGTRLVHRSIFESEGTSLVLQPSIIEAHLWRMRAGRSGNGDTVPTIPNVSPRWDPQQAGFRDETEAGHKARPCRGRQGTRRPDGWRRSLWPAPESSHGTTVLNLPYVVPSSGCIEPRFVSLSRDSLKTPCASRKLRKF
jgi:hypothetical protein